MRKTIWNVTIVVPVLMTSCQVLEKRKVGPRAAQSSTTARAQVKAVVLLARRVTRSDSASIRRPTVPVGLRVDIGTERCNANTNQAELSKVRSSRPRASVRASQEGPVVTFRSGYARAPRREGVCEWGWGPTRE